MNVATEAVTTISRAFTNDKVEVRFYFRTVAGIYAGLFFGTLLFSGIVTKTLSDFSPSTDKILLYYGKMNPCVLFDHYPAKVVGLIGMGMFVLTSVAWSTMLTFRMYIEGRVVPFLWTSVVVSVMTLLDLNFINIFTTDLYASATETRRLHAHDMEDYTLTVDDMNLIKVHSAYYCAFVVANFWLFLHLLHIQKNRIAKWSVSAKVKFGLLITVGAYGMIMHITAMLLTVAHERRQKDLVTDKAMEATFHGMALKLSEKTKTAMWGWIVILVMRFLMPSGSGVQASFKASKVKGDHGLVMPSWLVGRTLRLIAVVLAAGGLLDPEFEESEHAKMFKLASSLRHKPFAYFTAPAFFGTVALGAAGFGLTVIAKRLETGKFSVGLMLSAIVMSFAHLGSMTIVIRQQSFTWVFLALLVLGYVAWVMQLSLMDSQGKPIVAGVYCAAGVGVLAANHWLGHWSLDYVFLLWLCLYNLVVPEGPGMYMTVEKLEGEDDNHAYDSLEEVS